MSDVYYGGFLDPLIDTEETVLAIRAQAMALYQQGKVLMEWNGEGTQGKRQFVAPVQDILRETRICLKQMNPGKYGSIVRQSQMLRLG